MNTRTLACSSNGRAPGNGRLGFNSLLADMIALKRTSEPAEYPVTVAEVKTTGRVSTTAHDTLLQNLIYAATAEAEDICNRSLITQTWEYVIAGFPSLAVKLPRPKLQSVTSVKYIDSNGDEQTLASEYYQVSTTGEPGEIRLSPSYQWPAVGVGYSEPVTITFVAGYGLTSSAVPEKIRQAIMAIVVHWYDNGIGEKIPVGAYRVLDNHRVKYEL